MTQNKSQANPKLPAAEIVDRLTAPARDYYGTGIAIRNFETMEAGHAGLTFGFQVCDDNGRCVDDLILKMSPPGVRRQGVADIYRQARLLRELHHARVPVPALRWAEEHDEPLGTPYIVMERVPGRECFNLDPPQRPGNEVSCDDLWRMTAETLATLAQFDWRTHLVDWQRVVPLAEEFDRWERTLRKSPEPAWVDLGLRARDCLASCMPDSEPLRLIHGDFQPSNLMIHDGRISAIIDWDLAEITSGLIDVGWMLMFADREYWGSHWRGLFAPSIEELERRYLHLTGEDGGDLTWYRAYAGYRFGAISCLNVKLHREGRRPDPVWDQLALDVPRLFERSRELALKAGRD